MPTVGEDLDEELGTYIPSRLQDDEQDVENTKENEEGDEG